MTFYQSKSISLHHNQSPFSVIIDSPDPSTIEIVTSKSQWHHLPELSHHHHHHHHKEYHPINTSQYSHSHQHRYHTYTLCHHTIANYNHQHDGQCFNHLKHHVFPHQWCDHGYQYHIHQLITPLAITTLNKSSISLMLEIIQLLIANISININMAEVHQYIDIRTPKRLVIIISIFMHNPLSHHHHWQYQLSHS